jgi:hypothetical protein
MRDYLPDPGRRHVIHRLALGAAGSLILPFVASAHPIQHHLRDEAVVALADAQASAPGYVPAFLDAHQLDTLALLAERIVPGSTAANSSQFIDQLLTVSTTDEQRALLQALGGFEQLAIARARVPWTQLTEPQQDELLTLASTASAGKTTDAPGAARAAHVTIRDHFENIKGWIAGAYYSSEPGMRELGWTGGVVFPTMPGCDHPAGH